MDELHMVNDDGRGYLMELLATKVLTVESGIQVIGMSASLTV
jgi:replicative superfamily II helicase